MRIGDVTATPKNSGQLPDDPAAGVDFGCTQRAELGAFLIAYGLEQRARGIAMGVVVGALGAVAAYVYFRQRAKA